MSKLQINNSVFSNVFYTTQIMQIIYSIHGQHVSIVI